MKDVIVIGAGAVGAFIARNLSRFNLNVLVLDKDNDVCNATSCANSAISHSGYDPVPGTKKAKFNVLGNQMMEQVCKELDVPYEQIGTLTVATEEAQLKTLEELKERATINGVPSEIVDQARLREMEPNISEEALGALYCPTGGIINPFLLTCHAMENALDNGVELALNQEVKDIKKVSDHFVVYTQDKEYESKVVINAAGVYSDKIAAMIEPIDWFITPRKGEYYVLDHFKGEFVNHVVFPLPSAKGKGVLVSKTTSGNYIIGPSSEPMDDRECVACDSLTLANVKQQASMLIKNIPFYQQIRVYAGLRATPSTHDFIIESSKSEPAFINVAGIESPGLVSSPAIGKYVVEELVSKVLKLEENKNYKKNIKPYTKPLDLSNEERNALIKEHPEFGRMVCQCEKVSLGEILEVLHRKLPCNSLKALKKRTRAGFGKCQGGFCQPISVSIIAEEKEIDVSKVSYDKDGGYFAPYKSNKGGKR